MFEHTIGKHYLTQKIPMRCIDVGKIMFLWGVEEDGQVGKATGQQWALGGDTWVK